MGTHSREDAVPSEKAADAIAALEAAGYESELTETAARQEHSGYVVIASRRQLDGDDAGHRNLHEGHAALREAAVEFHHYSHGVVVAGGAGSSVG